MGIIIITVACEENHHVLCNMQHGVCYYKACVYALWQLQVYRAHSGAKTQVQKAWHWEPTEVDDSIKFCYPHS